jgi:phosphopantetheinyl transferase
MPVKTELTSNSLENLYLWEISETNKTLIGLFCADGSALPPIQNPERLRHYLASRLLVRSVFPNQKLEKDAFGKPFIQGFSGHISLSHSGDMAGLLVSSTDACGLDIEVISERILRIAPRFCAPEELTHQDSASRHEAMHLIWGAKECMYKAYGRKEIDFRTQLRVAPFTVAEAGLLQGQLMLKDGTEHYHIAYRMREGYILLWTTRVSG